MRLLGPICSRKEDRRIRSCAEVLYLSGLSPGSARRCRITLADYIVYPVFRTEHSVDRISNRDSLRKSKEVVLKPCRLCLPLVLYSSANDNAKTIDSSILTPGNQFLPTLTRRAPFPPLLSPRQAFRVGLPLFRWGMFPIPTSMVGLLGALE